MRAMQTATAPTKAQIGTGLKAALNILDRWSCTPDEEQAILGIASRSTFYKYKKNPGAANLSRDQVERISYILNMHQALRIVFSNPANTYGFMKMPNGNPFFNGQTPINVISKGNFANLYETFKRIDAMRSSQW